MLRGLICRISAAAPHVIFPAIASRITCRLVTARSFAPGAQPMTESLLGPALHRPLYERSNHLLQNAVRSCTPYIVGSFPCIFGARLLRIRERWEPCCVSTSVHWLDTADAGRSRSLQS